MVVAWMNELAVIIPHLEHTMKKLDDLLRLAKLLRAKLDVCEDEELKMGLLLRLVGVVKGLEEEEEKSQRKNRLWRPSEKKRTL